MKVMKISCVFIILFVLFFFHGDKEETERMVPILIGFNGHKALDVITNYGGIVRFSYSIINAAAGYVPESKIDDISNNPRVSYVEIDEPFTLGSAISARPPKPPASQQIPWGVDRIDADLAWARSRGAGVKVAVLDSGIDYTHPDLAGNYAGGIDLWDNDSNPMDDYGHGTSVAGVIAAVDNQIGVVGVAPSARLYAVRIGGKDPYRGVATDWATMIAGLQWCVANGMQVINDSAWGSTYSRSYESALQAVWDAGIVYVAAAGNQGNTGYSFFSGYDGLAAHISATNSSDTVASYSSHGHFIDLCAPSDVLSTALGGGYQNAGGTSHASPHVAGVAALILGANPTFSNRDVLKRLYVTAERLSTEWWNEYSGWGLVDAEKSVNPPGEPSSLQSIAVLPSSAIGEEGFYTRFCAIGTADSSQYNLTYDATWANSNPSSAMLFWDGLAKGLSAGSADLTASYGGKSSTAVLQVNPASKDIITIEEARWTYTTKPNKGTLSVTATSTWGGSATLTVEGYGTMSYNASTGNYTFSKARVSCPFTVFVSSSGGGRSWAFSTVTQPAASPAENMLTVTKDKETMLLQNMPNPPNPDTWIPFRLSNAEYVVIKVYNAAGQLVRRLDLGQKAPGDYISKEKSAYWDGKNEDGERVSSGIYFYVMEAGTFRATKKMLILK